MAVGFFEAPAVADDEESWDEKAGGGSGSEAPAAAPTESAVRPPRSGSTDPCSQQSKEAIEAEVRKETIRQEALRPLIDRLLEQIQRAKDLLAKVGEPSTKDVTTIAGLKQALLKQRDEAARLANAQKAERANRTARCFNDGGSPSGDARSCRDAGGDLLSPKACAISVFRKRVAGDQTDGSGRTSPADAKKADLAAKNFENRLNQMLADLEGAPPAVEDIDQFIARHQKELAAFGAAGQFVLKELARCDKDVTADVQRELQDPQSLLGSQAAALGRAAAATATAANTLIRQLDTEIRDVAKRAFGIELNAASPGCSTPAAASNPAATAASGTGAADAQLQCLQALAATLQALLDGTPPPGARAPIVTSLRVDGSTGSTVTCKGLVDCADQAGKLLADSKARVADLRARVASCPGSGSSRP